MRTLVLLGVGSILLLIVVASVLFRRTTIPQAAPPSIQSSPQADPVDRDQLKSMQSQRVPPQVESAKSGLADTFSAEAPSIPEEVQEQLVTQINDSIDGFLYIDNLLDQVLEYAKLPIEEHVDFEYDDDEVAAYRIQGLPGETIGHFLVGLQPFERDGKRFRYFQMEIQMPPRERPEFYRDSFREGPRIHLTLDFDDNGEPGFMALMTERRIALRQSRDSGIDAYHGRFTSGAGYKVNLAEPQSVISETYGIIDGNYAYGQAFQGVRPLHGDVDVDPARINRLLAQLNAHFDRIRRKQ